LGFKFNLQKILDFRIDALDDEKKELSKRNMLLREAEQRLEYLKQQVVQFEQELRQMYIGQISQERLTKIEMFRQHIKDIRERQIPQQQIVIQQRQLEVQEQKEKVRVAHMEVKKFEKLKEKKSDEYKEEEKLEEMKNIDQIAGIMMARKMIMGDGK
jgi:flagellar FliJ protein